MAGPKICMWGRPPRADHERVNSFSPFATVPDEWISAKPSTFILKEQF